MCAESVRPPAAADAFYPARSSRLAGVVDRLLDEATEWSGPRPWAILVPHAGYPYSGPVAASAYAAIRPWAPAISRVVLLGPAHFVPLEGCAVPTVEAWRTPLGDVPIDLELREAAVGAGCARDDEPHAAEHSLEVQAPFLQRLLGSELHILPVAVGRSAPGEVAGVLGAIGRTADAVVALDVDGVGPWDACGSDGLRGTLVFARAAAMEIRLLDLRTSGDTAGDPDRVVGYGAFAITGPSPRSTAPATVG